MSRIATIDPNQRLFACIGTGQTVVDCGCGSGEMLKKLQGRFVNRIGLEISDRRLSECNPEGCDLRQADMNKPFPLPDSYADAVIANQAIEHVVDPFQFTAEIYRVLKTGGRYFVTTPNIRYIKSISKLLLSGYGPRTSGGNTRDGAWDDGHLHYFTHRDLRELFTRTGFREVRSSALIDLNGGGVVRRAMNYGSDSWLIREFFRVTFYFAEPNSLCRVRS